MIDLKRFPRSGPFNLAPSFATKPRRLAALITLFGVLAACACFALATSMYTDALQMVEIWETGVAIEGEASYDGTETYDNGLHTWDFDVRFSLPGQDQVTFPARFKSVRNHQRADDFSIHYLPSDPQKAVFSWQYEARDTAFQQARKTAGSGAAALLGALFLAYASLAPVRRLYQRATYGQVEFFPVFQEDDREAQNMVVLRLLTPRGKDLQIYFRPGIDDPVWSDDKSQVLVLYHPGSDSVTLLREDGFPLVLA